MHSAARGYLDTRFFFIIIISKVIWAKLGGSSRIGGEVLIGMEFENSRNWCHFRLVRGGFLETVAGLPGKEREGSTGFSCPHLQGRPPLPKHREKGGQPRSGSSQHRKKGGQPRSGRSQSKERCVGCVSLTQSHKHRENAQAFRHSHSLGPIHPGSLSSISCLKHTEDSSLNNTPIFSSVLYFNNSSAPFYKLTCNHQ